MLEDAEEILTKLLIQEHFKKEGKKYLISKEELIKFVIKYNKILKEVENE